MGLAARALGVIGRRRQGRPLLRSLEVRLLPGLRRPLLAVRPLLETLLGPLLPLLAGRSLLAAEQLAERIRALLILPTPRSFFCLQFWHY